MQNSGKSFTSWYNFQYFHFYLINYVILASQWGLDRVVLTLIEHHADINKKVLSRKFHLETHN
jgi:hypothetical protein